MDSPKEIIMENQAQAVAMEDDYSAGFQGKTAEDAIAAAATEKQPPVEVPGEEKPPEGEEQPPLTEEQPPIAEDWKAKFETTEKRFKDTQAAFTKESQRTADLEKRLAELETKLTAASEKSAEEGPGPDEEWLQLQQDYPGIEKAIQNQAERLLKEKFGDLDPTKVKEIRDSAFAIKYDNAVIYGVQDPETKTFVPGNPRYYAITNDVAYWEWYGAKGYNVPEGHPPWKAISILNEYETEKAEKVVAAEVGKHDEEAARKAAEIKAGASGALPAGVRSGTTAVKKDDPNDYSGGFAAATTKT
jgi:hypothetical protein